MNDNTELKRLADAAKNWGGEVGEDRWYTAECFKQPYFSVPDAEFIAACDPGSIRALIAENERLQGCEEVLRQLASYCGCGGYNAPEVDPEVFAKKIMDGINILNDPLVALADKRAAERDELKLEVAGLKTGYEAYERVNAELKAECEVLRKDAGRWQFVRNPVGSGSPFAIWSERTNLFLGKFADEAIDAAMGKGDRP
ncbi:hypothetical protein [Pseudomonas fragi]|uniref:hypothetical protein n=1 Tax=Pseudomonas fragi TaxID=296 RepID=UPI000BA1EF99|nr:hypothetical protein [Pseudomonas fragi]PAA08883.1 hypothetical protein CJU78_09290 [Pseudomonas fragi]